MQSQEMLLLSLQVTLERTIRTLGEEAEDKSCLSIPSPPPLIKKNSFDFMWLIFFFFLKISLPFSLTLSLYLGIIQEWQCHIYSSHMVILAFIDMKKITHFLPIHPIYFHYS